MTVLWKKSVICFGNIISDTLGIKKGYVPEYFNTKTPSFSLLLLIVLQIVGTYKWGDYETKVKAISCHTEMSMTIRIKHINQL
jgi:hypothetical protein